MYHQFKSGDRVRIRAYKSEPGKGLTYDMGVVTTLDAGCSGGWDVYDAKRDDGTEFAFYGFSVERVYAKR
jgi:hypothetical protein